MLGDAKKIFLLFWIISRNPKFQQYTDENQNRKWKRLKTSLRRPDLSGLISKLSDKVCQFYCEDDTQVKAQLRDNLSSFLPSVVGAWQKFLRSRSEAVTLPWQFHQVEAAEPHRGRDERPAVPRASSGEPRDLRPQSLEAG